MKGPCSTSSLKSTGIDAFQFSQGSQYICVLFWQKKSYLGAANQNALAFFN